MSTSSVPRLAPDPAKADELRRRLVDDLVAAMASAAVASGHSLGLYRALAGGGPQTPRELAQRTGAGERYLREWLRGQAARGYAHYDAEAVTFSLTPEQAACLADEESATFMGGAFATAARQWLRHATGNPDQEVRRMAGIEIKSFDAPDEVRPFEGNGKADVVNVGGKLVGRGSSSRAGGGRRTSSRLRAPSPVRCRISATACRGG